MTTDSSLGRWHSVPGLLALVLVCAGAVGMEAASPDASSLRSTENTPLAPADTQHISLEEGWNLISSRLVPDNPSMESVFAPIADAVKVVRSPSGAVYKPGDGTNTIGDWDVQAGYEVYVTSPQTLVIEGRLPVSNEADIPLEKGWNTVSYLPNTTQSPTEALSSIEGALSMVKDETGSVFVPDEGINQLEQLAPGQGFKMHVSTSQTLSYPDPPLSSDLEYPTACLERPGAVPVGEYGTLTPGASADSLQRVENLNAIERAISSAPQGGVVCLPGGTGASQDSLYVTFNDPVDISGGGRNNPHLEIARDSISLIGAGACGWGSMNGCSYIGTPGQRDSYYYRSDGDDDGTDEVIRGIGIQLVMSSTEADPARSITLKGFHINGNSGFTGNYNFSLANEAPAAENGWDLSHKGISPGFGGDPKTDILIEDVQVSAYKGEVIYNGGFTLGTITARRIWSHNSNGSAWNIATADSQLVEDSKFGPDVRFWGEFLAEGIPNASSLHRNNTYEGCGVGNGCLAMAVDDAGNLVEGQTWTWKNNTFNLTTSSSSSKRLFLLTAGPYKLIFKNNTSTGGELWLTNDGAGSETVTLDVSDNTHNAIGAHPYHFQNGAFRGSISGNTFQDNASVYRAVGGSLSELSITENTYENEKKVDHAGSGPDSFPLVQNNTYSNNSVVGPKNIFNSDETVRAYVERKAFNSGPDGPWNAELEARAADGQRVWLFGDQRQVTFPADSSNHGWTSDFSLSSSSDSIRVEFDRTSMEWFLTE